MAGPDALLLKALQPPCRPAALGKLREGVVRPFPRELVRDPDLACRREVIRGIEGCRRNVDGVRFRITLIRQRGTAPAAECASYAGGRTKTGGLRRRKHEVSRTKDDPRYGRGTCSEPAGPAVTKRCDDRHAVDAVSDCPAQAPTLDNLICHISHTVNDLAELSGWRKGLPPGELRGDLGHPGRGVFRHDERHDARVFHGRRQGAVGNEHGPTV